MGLQHGTLNRERIQKSMDIYRKAFLELGKLQWNQALRIAKSFVPTIQEYDVEALEEVKGIAEGAGCRIEEIIALNSRTEIMFSAGKLSTLLDGCTTVCVLPERSATGNTILAQNWDWKPSCEGSAILLEKRMRKGVSSFNFIEAGMVARIGMNSAGIGSAGNYLETDKDGKTPGVPIPFIKRKILSSRHISQAIKAVTNSKRGSSTNYMIGYRQGFAIDIEVTPDELYVLYPQDGLLVHTNHFLSPNFKAQDISRSRITDTLYRNWRLERILSSKTGKIGVDDLKKAFSDHFGYPYSICRHYDIHSEGLEGIQTNGSIIMDLNSGEIEFAAGRPCESGYKSFRFEVNLI